MGNSPFRRLQPLSDEEKERKSHHSLLESLLEDVAVYAIGAHLLDSDVYAWSVCSRSSFHQLKRYRFKCTIPLDRALRMSDSHSYSSANNIITFGTPAIVSVADGNLLSCIPFLPPSVHTLIMSEGALTSTPELPPLPPSITALTFKYNHWDRGDGSASPSVSSSFAKSIEKLPSRIQLNNGSLRILHLPREADKIGLHFNQFPDSLRTLQIYAPLLNEQRSLANLRLSDALTDLTITGAISSPDCFPTLPRCLERFHATISLPLTKLMSPLPASITDLNMTFEDNVVHEGKFELPSSLTSLTLLRFVGIFPFAQCPPALTRLKLLQFQSMEEIVSIPPTITHLTLRAKPNTSFAALHLPNSVTYCNLDLPLGPSLESIQWPSRLEKLELYGTKPSDGHEKWIVPPTVTNFELGYNCSLQPYVILLPANLLTLSLKQFQGQFCLKELAQNLPHKITTLILPDRQLDETLVNWNPPPSLTSLTTPLHWTCKGLQQPQTLRRLVVTRCLSPDGAKFAKMFPNLEELELHYLEVHRKLHFPLNLRRLILSTATEFPEKGLDPFVSPSTQLQSVKEIIIRNVLDHGQAAGATAEKVREFKIRKWKLPADCVIIAEP